MNVKKVQEQHSLISLFRVESRKDEI